MRGEDGELPIIVGAGAGSGDLAAVATELGVTAVVRRPYPARELLGLLRSLAPRPEQVELRPLALDLGRLRVDGTVPQFWLDGRTVSLPPMEFLILRYFAERVGAVVTRKELLRAVWGESPSLSEMSSWSGEDSGQERGEGVVVLVAPSEDDVLDLAAVAGAAPLFKALADPVRVRLLALVRQAPAGEACFCDLADEFDMPQSSLSHHLKILVQAGLLSRERRGTWSWYRVQPEPLDLMSTLLRPGGPFRAYAVHRPECD